MRSVFANHAHVFPESIRKDGTVQELKKVMDETGITKCVCFAPFYEYFHGELDANEWLYRAVRDDEQLVGFGVIDFRKGNRADQVKRMVDLGMKGIKLHPAFQKVRIDSPECCEVYEEAEKQNLLISFHTGIHWHRIADYNMLLYDEVAYRYPKLRISLEHVGGYCFFNEALAVMQNNRRRGMPPRVFAGLTSVFDRDENRPWFLSDQQVMDLLWQMGEDTVLFGIDFPFNNAKVIHEAIEHVEHLNIPESAKDAILGGNLARELGMEW